MATRTELAYIAGLLDADGSFSISYSTAFKRFAFVVNFTQLSYARETVEFVQRTLTVGKIYERKRLIGQSVLIWRTNSPQEAMAVCVILSPHIRIKQKELGILFEAAKLYLEAPREKSSRGGYDRISKETAEKLMEMKSRMNLHE